MYPIQAPHLRQCARRPVGDPLAFCVLRAGVGSYACDLSQMNISTSSYTFTSEASRHANPSQRWIASFVGRFPHVPDRCLRERDACNPTANKEDLGP